MLATAVASPFLSDVDDSVAKALGFALTAVFFFALVLKVNAATAHTKNSSTTHCIQNLPKIMVSIGHFWQNYFKLIKNVL